MKKDKRIRSLKEEKVYVVLNEDRGGDTLVTIHRNYKSAKKRLMKLLKS